MAAAPGGAVGAGPGRMGAVRDPPVVDHRHRRRRGRGGGGARGVPVRVAPLATVIADNATALRARRRIEQAATEWGEEQRSARRLWTGDQLAAARADNGARFDDTSVAIDADDSAGPGRSTWWSATSASRLLRSDLTLGSRVSAGQHPPRPVPAVAHHSRSRDTAGRRARRRGDRSVQLGNDVADSSSDA